MPTRHAAVVKARTTRVAKATRRTTRLLPVRSDEYNTPTYKQGMGGWENQQPLLDQQWLYANGNVISTNNK